MHQHSAPRTAQWLSAGVRETIRSRSFRKISPAGQAVSWHKTRKFVDLPFGRVAYVEKGEGPAALVIHGWSLNGYQWRGPLDRLYTQRRCLAPDMMSMGWTETPDAQEISPTIQAAMLGQLLDKSRIDTVDLVGNDSGAVEEVRRRATMYQAAGCDGIFVPGLTDGHAPLVRRI